MDISRALVFTAALSLSFQARAGLNLREGCGIEFASKDQAAEILGRRDDFIRELSPFDRAARLKTDRSVSEDEFLAFVKRNALSWNESEKTKIETAVTKIRPSLDALPLSLPKIIYLVKTTGAEEGKAFYTRDSAIMLPATQLDDATGELLEKTIAHEVFHIWSRKNPRLREKMYASIGFTKCAEIDLPVELRRRKITNPDAPRNDHSIHLRFNGREVNAMPILFSDTEKYDVKRGGEFFDYLQFKFLLLPSDQLVSPGEVTGFFDQVGRNTSYIIHPEEILADNFALLVIGQHDVPSPEIIDRTRRIFAGN